jgi:hypothetical protein
MRHSKLPRSPSFATPTVDSQARHLLVQGAPWNLETLQCRPDVATGFQQASLDRRALEFLDLGRQ